MTDIVKRLLDPDDMDEYHDVRRNAAIEIERLRAARNTLARVAQRLGAVGTEEDIEAAFAAALEPKP